MTNVCAIMRHNSNNSNNNNNKFKQDISATLDELIQKQMELNTVSVCVFSCMENCLYFQLNNLSVV